MTKQVFGSGLGSNYLLDGGKQPSHALVGEPSNFYVYVRDESEPWSKWIKGDTALWHQLLKPHTARDAVGFRAGIDRVFKERQRGAR